MKDRSLNHSDNWKTPDSLYSELNAEFGFDFDPCPLNAGEITPDKDGLLIDWGLRNFINPPYSRKLKEAFVARAVEFKKEGRLCVMLLPVSTSTKLFHDVVLPNADDIRFLRGRVKFEGVNTFGELVKNKAGMHDSMIVVFDGMDKSVVGRVIKGDSKKTEEGVYFSDLALESAL
jgi:site-specific DNA-methyltransferase (adenine-specific)